MRSLSGKPIETTLCNNSGAILFLAQQNDRPEAVSHDAAPGRLCWETARISIVVIGSRRGSTGDAESISAEYLRFRARARRRREIASRLRKPKAKPTIRQTKANICVLSTLVGGAAEQRA